MATVERLQSEQRSWLHGVPWETYEQLRNSPENERVRMIYDQGELEIMAPSMTHEEYSHLIGLIIQFWTLERNIDIKSCGTMTCKRKDLQQGFEPDKCFYVAHEGTMRAKRDLDLTIDPPPDLAVEIDLSGRRAKERLAMYAAFGVPEVWWHDGQGLRMFALVDDNYQERTSSMSFPGLPPAEIEKVLAKLGTESETALIRSFRDWVRSVSL